MASVNGVNVLNSVNFKAGGVNDKISSPANDNKPSNDKKMKTTTKLMIGAGALAAAVIGGIMFHNAKVGKKVSEKVLGNIFGDVRNVEILGKDEIIKIGQSLKKKGVKLKEGDSILLINRSESSGQLFRGYDEANVCMAIQRGDEVIARGMMNVEETSENIAKAFQNGKIYRINVGTLD